MSGKLAVVVLMGAMLLLALGCGQETHVATVAEQPPEVEEHPEDPVPKVVDPGPILEKENPHLYFWRTSQQTPARIVFDNGTNAKLFVRLATNTSIEIAPRDYAELKCDYGPLTFEVSDSNDPTWQEITCELSNTWIYNHRAASDYEFTTTTYSNLSFNLDSDESQEIVGQVLFKVDVFYLFEPAPEEIKVWTLPDNNIPIAVRNSLDRLGDPEPGRVVRPFTNPQGEKGYVVQLYTDESTACYAVEYPFRDEDRVGERVTDGSAELVVDDQRGRARIEVDGVPVGEAGNGLLAQISLDPGKHRVRRFDADGTVVQDTAAEFQARTSYKLGVARVEEVY